MATIKISALTAAVGIDGTADYLPIVQSGTTNKINRTTLLGITGSPVGTSDTQNLTNKTLNNTNSLTVKDGSLTIQNTADTTKQAVFSLAGITTGNTRTYTLPNASVTLASLTGTETLTNKTITSPSIGGTVGGSATYTGVTLTTATITSPAITTPKITTGINDANNNAIVNFTATGSAANQITVTNATAGNAPSIIATGSDANIGLTINTKGTGALSFGTGLTNGVSTQANAGTAGGTMYYTNLGGIKLCWGFTGTLTLAAQIAVAYGITFPTSFFSTIQSFTISNSGTAGGSQFTAITGNVAPTSTNVSFYFISSANTSISATMSAAFWLVIGT